MRPGPDGRGRWLRLAGVPGGWQQPETDPASPHHIHAWYSGGRIWKFRGPVAPSKVLGRSLRARASQAECLPPRMGSPWPSHRNWLGTSTLSPSLYRRWAPTVAHEVSDKSRRTEPYPTLLRAAFPTMYLATDFHFSREICISVWGRLNTATNSLHSHHGEVGGAYSPRPSLWLGPGTVFANRGRPRPKRCWKQFLNWPGSFTSRLSEP